MDMEVSVESDSDLEEDDEGEWIIYTKGETQEPIESWLPTVLPSMIPRSSGIEWICVRNRNPWETSGEPDLEGLYNSWEKLVKSGCQVNFSHIKELALNHNVKCGKWALFANSGGKIDHLWSVVASNIVYKTLPCHSAKVSTYNETDSHVICIYNEDFTNMDQVLEAEQAIRNMGIKAKMIYKPDCYTYLNIYRKNQWGIPASIMFSDFDVIKGCSIVQSKV
ncbi:hypothetical protein ACF0H5_003394 [Mactra antiquata]